MQVRWVKKGSVAHQEEVPKVCLERQVSQVSELYAGRVERAVGVDNVLEERLFSHSGI